MIIQYDKFGCGGLINLPNNSFFQIYLKESSEINEKEYFDYNIVLSYSSGQVEILYLNYLVDDYGLPFYEIQLFADAILERITKLIIENMPIINMENVFYDILEQGGYRAKWLEKGYISEGDL